MTKRLRSLGHWLLIGTLFVSLGGHQALLQTFAWGNMLVDFSRSESLVEAAKKTFDGDHPCKLCKVVSESKKQEKKKPLAKADIKLEVALPTPVTLKAPSGIPVVTRVPEYRGRGENVSQGVLTQPPEIG